MTFAFSMHKYIFILYFCLYGVMPVNLKTLPEVHMNATQLIISNGFTVESHYAETDDGFILNIQRIPHGHNTPSHGVVLLQHGLAAGSDSFLLNMVNGSLGFILTNAGFDVWFANSRGNIYSMTHKKYNPSQDEFWDWSWQEQADFDLPATIHYILNVTKQQRLVYIAHSQGTLIANAKFSEDKSLSDKVKLFIALGPIAKVKHVRRLLGFIASFIKPHFVYEMMGRKSFNTNSSLSDWKADKFCATLPGEYLCNDMSSMVMGFDTKNLNMTRIPVYQSHMNEGSSVKNIVHYLQEIKSGKFQKYDYGSTNENYNHYNQSVPPEYDIQRTEVPVALFYGDKDFLSDKTDVQYLLDNLPNIVQEKEFKNWAHTDFLVGKDAPGLLYKDILLLLKTYSEISKTNVFDN